LKRNRVEEEESSCMVRKRKRRKQQPKRKRKRRGKRKRSSSCVLCGSRGGLKRNREKQVEPGSRHLLRASS
jgi:hypothetical protein